MRGEVVVREVVDEDVEAVARDEPAADRSGVRVDRPGGTVAHRRAAHRSRPTRTGCRRRTGEARAPYGRPAASTDARAAAVAGEVDRGRDEPGVVGRLEHRDGAAPEMLAVHVDDRVAHRAA